MKSPGQRNRVLALSVMDNQGRSEAAVEYLRKALLVAPDYIDAMFNLDCCCNGKAHMPKRQTILAAVFGRRSFIEMGGEGPAVAEVLRDSN